MPICTLKRFIVMLSIYAIPLSVIACSSKLFNGRRTQSNDFVESEKSSADAKKSTTGGLDETMPLNDKVGFSDPRRLTNYEYDKAVLMLLGDTSEPAKQRFPDDITLGSFDTVVEHQGVVGQPSVQGYEDLAQQIATKFIADLERRDQYIGCKPSKVDDNVCLEPFINKFTSAAFSRPLKAEEIKLFVKFATKHAVDNNDFYTGIEAAIAAVLQMPEFLYFAPIGKEIPISPGVFKLGSFEYAKRLSLALTGGLPDDELMQAAKDGGLDNAEGSAAQAARLLESDAALANIQRFHAIWLNYFKMSISPDLAAAFLTETQALIKKLVWDDGLPWVSLFSHNQTFLDSKLATHYKLPAPATESGWVSYGDSGRAGILSHGSILASGINFGDTSPVKRGQFILENVLCRTLPVPPPNVNVDVAPPAVNGNSCKEARYRAYTPKGSTCAACHNKIDPVGFGLERFDMLGQYRTEEKDDDTCKISGKGAVPAYEDFTGGEFNGPAELSAVVVSTGEVQSCLIKKLYEYSMGHVPAPSDQHFVDILSKTFVSNKYDFKRLMLDMVTAPEFHYIQRK